MELKIRIKEVKEEKRPLTIGEKCMISVSREDIFSRSYMDKVQAELDCIGFVDYVGYDRTCGLFRTETIRDATQEEYRAWAYLQLKKHCTCTERKLSSVDCDDCFLSGACITSDFKTATAKYILKNKEVILELVD